MSLSMLLLSLTFSQSPAPLPTLRDLCPKPTVTTDSAKFHRLGDLPPAQVTLAVLRSTECPVSPILARDRLGPAPKLRR